MRGIKSFVTAGALFGASCLLVAAAFAQGNNAPAPGKAPGNAAGGFQAPQKDDQTCIGNRDACGKVPGNIAGGFQAAGFPTVLDSSGGRPDPSDLVCSTQIQRMLSPAGPPPGI